MTAPAHSALVLNADFQPVRLHPLSIWGFERTMCAVMKDRVSVVEEYDVEYRSANSTWRPPSVVALKRYVKVPETVAFNRLNIFLRDDFRCQYCGEKFSSRDLTFDHVIPRAKGGPNTMLNVVSACMPCNSRKGDKLIKPMREPWVPTPRELLRKAPILKSDLCQDWRSYLYWCGILESDD